MKPIKIHADNYPKIFAALESVNGKAFAHTYACPKDIEAVISRAENKLKKLLGDKKKFKGAKVVSISGNSVPNCYKYSRQATQIVVERRSTGWFLRDAKVVRIWKEAGRENVMLSPEQDGIAVKRLRGEYVVAS